MNNRINRIVVMGGSFNPPTVAHQVLMKAAMTAVDANLGYFVPVSDAYLRRKMRYTQQPLILSPELRIQMLNCMCADTKMQVCTNEIGTVKARTTETLKEIQAQHPESELYFIMGDDKMKRVGKGPAFMGSPHCSTSTPFPGPPVLQQQISKVFQSDSGQM